MQLAVRVRLVGCAIVGWATVTVWAPTAAAASPRWSVQPTPSPAGATLSALAGVSCASRHDCLAVGHFTDRAGAGAPLAERWDGAHWSVARIAKPAGARSTLLFEVSCATPSSCMAVGSRTRGNGVTVPLAERLTGGRLSISRTPATGAGVSYLGGVSCLSPRYCIAVGYAGNDAGTVGVPLAERWNGTSWARLAIARPAGAAVAILSGISCTSTRSCVAVGFLVGSDRVGRPLAERWDGRRWSIERTQSPQAATEVQLAGVSCAASGRCIAAGFFGIVTGIEVMLAERRDHEHWTIQRTLYPRGATGVQFAGVSCGSPRSCTAVGFFGNAAGQDDPLVERWNGMSWAIQPTPAPAATVSNSLANVSCTSSSTCTAVGSSLTRAGTVVTLAERYS